MATLVKICGLKTAATMHAALDAGADFVGLVFYPPSPRNLEAAQAAPLAEMARGHARIVALMVDPTDTFAASVVDAAKPDILQLHGSETPERVLALRQRFGVPMMKAIKVETAADTEGALAFTGAADHILFDAKAPKGFAGALPGGNGLSFDWRLLDAIQGRLDFMLSGGLTPDNVAAAVRLTRPWAVDVSSGVEASPGEKDVTLIARFVAAAKA